MTTTLDPDRKHKMVVEFRRGEILAAATRVFGEKGFEATKMEEIALAAGVAKGTLYLYFESKDEIYVTTVEQALGQLAAVTAEHVGRESTVAGKLAAFVRVRIAFWDEQQTLYRVILNSSRDGEHRARSIGWQRIVVVYLAAIFQEGAESGEIQKQDYTAAAWTVMDAIRGVNERRVFAEGRGAEEDTRFLTEFLWAGLRAGARV